MKTLIFLALVTGAGVYLASQNETGVDWVDRFFDQHDVSQRADDLVNQVENRINQLSEKHKAEQQESVKALQKRVAELEQSVAALTDNQPTGSDDITTFEPSQEVNSLEVAMPVTKAEQPAVTANRNNHVQQANLRDISERMQALSFGSALEN